MNVVFTPPMAVAKFVDPDLLSYLVVEFPTYEYANDLGTSAYRTYGDGNRFDVWIVEDITETPIGSFHIGND